MSDEEEFSFDDGVICKNCQRMFSFAQSSQTLHGVRFPRGDTSIIEAHCPRCHVGRTYYPKDIFRDKNEEDQSELVTQLRNEIAQLKVEKGVIQKQAEKLLETNLELVKQLSQTSSTENRVPKNDPLSESARPR